VLPRSNQSSVYQVIDVDQCSNNKKRAGKKREFVDVDDTSVYFSAYEKNVFFEVYNQPVWY